ERNGRAQPRRARELAKGVADVGTEIVQAVDHREHLVAGARAFEKSFARFLIRPEASERFGARSVGRKAARDQLGDALLDVKADLVIELALPGAVARSPAPEIESKGAAHRSLGGERSSEDAGDRRRVAEPARCLGAQVRAAFRRDVVIARLAVVVGDAPRGSDEALLLEAVEGLVQGAIED